MHSQYYLLVARVCITLRITISGKSNPKPTCVFFRRVSFDVVSLFKMDEQLPSIVTSVFVGLVYFFTLWSFISQVTEESVLIIKDFGIQLRILYRSGSEETKV